MPEKDRFEKSLGSGWCAAYQYSKNGNATPEEINGKLVKALTQVLRENSGVPGLQAMMDILITPPGSFLREGFDALDGIVRDQGGHRHTKIAVKVAKSLLVQQLASGGTLERQDVVHRLAEDVCSSLVKHYFFARVCPKLIADGKFRDHDEACRWQNQVEQDIQPAIGKIAGKLLQNTDAKGLRAPRRTATKVPTSDLLAEILV